MKRITELEKTYVAEVLASEFQSSSCGSMTDRLERKFAEIFESQYAIAFVNGTATLHAVLAAAGIGRGHEVIVPPLTMASTSLAVLHAGATPVFADIDPDTWTLSPAGIERNLTSRTRAIIPVSLYGLAPDMDNIMDFAERHGILVLEDSAQCFLGYYKSRVVGGLGHASSFSFQSSKHITCGEGGMVLTNDPDLALQIRRFNSLGYAGVGAGAGKGKIDRNEIQDPCYKRHVSLGWNYRMSDLCAAVALGQLERLSEFVEMRIKVASLYRQALEGCRWLIPQLVPSDHRHAYWSYVLYLHEKAEPSWHDFRDRFREFGGDGIYAAWQLTYLEPALRDRRISDEQLQHFSPGLCQVAEAIQPGLLQFKTNYFDLGEAAQQAEVLSRTIDYFGR